VNHGAFVQHERGLSELGTVNPVTGQCHRMGRSLESSAVDLCRSKKYRDEKAVVTFVGISPLCTISTKRRARGKFR
jgi:hypothetical protein